MSCLVKICAIWTPDFEDEFLFVRLIEEGSQANIDLYFRRGDPKQRAFAVKIYQRKEGDKLESDVFNGSLEAEITALKDLGDSELIIHLEAIYVDGDTIYLVFPFYQGGTLLQRMRKNKKSSEKEIRTIMTQILLALDLMHLRGFIHRDIKLNNVLMSSNDDSFQLVVADLGFAC